MAIGRHKPWSDGQKKALAWVSLVVFVLFFLLSGLVIGPPMLRFVRQPEAFRTWVEERGAAASIIFVGMVIVQVIIALIPGEPLEIGAGYAFGFWKGSALCLLGIVIGSAIVFWLVRRFGRPLVEALFSAEKVRSLRFLQKSRRRNILVFLVMFIPGTPKDLLSYFAGLLDISLPHWLLIVSIARLPSLLTSTIGGDAMGEERYLFAVLVFAATIVISGLGLLLYRRLSRDHEA